MSLINKGNVATGNIIEAQDVLNIIEALDGTAETMIIATGSFTGSFTGSLSGSFYGIATGSLYGTSSWAISCSQALSADIASTASYIDPTFISASVAASGFGGGGGSGTPGGTDKQIQFNSGSTFAGSSTLLYVYTSQSLQHGFLVKAKGNYSHAEGENNTSSGSYTHAEGKDSIAIGIHSHAEGRDTLTLGAHSHAEGEFTTAEATGSHAEGYRTVASGRWQHVQGVYNISSSVDCAFIIGNGTGVGTNRKNLVFAAGNEFQITGSLIVTGSASIKGLTQSAGNNNVLTYNTTTGLLSYTASSAVGSGGGGSQFTYEIGQYVSAQGGVIFHRWLSTSSGGTPTAGTVQNYLVVALSNTVVDERWTSAALYNTSVPGATSSWDGNTNTTAIINSGATDGAAHACYNLSVGGQTDWYLPSMDEIWKLYGNRWEVQQGLVSASPASYNLIIDGGTYWTSNQFDSQYAYTFYTGPSVSSGPNFQQTLKSDPWAVRPIRKFSI